jgi:paraquat-inducible protein B
MSQKANPAVIGVFVVGAVALLVTGVLVFGSGRFFHRKVQLRGVL